MFALRSQVDSESRRICPGGLPEVQKPVLESPATPHFRIYGRARVGVKPKATKVVQN